MLSFLLHGRVVEKGFWQVVILATCHFHPPWGVAEKLVGLHLPTNFSRFAITRLFPAEFGETQKT